MADQKLTALAELVNVVNTDILYVVDDPGGVPLSLKITRANLLGSGLTDIVALDPTQNDNFIVADGVNWTQETPTQVRTTLGLVAGGAGDIWVEKAGDTMTGALTVDGSADAVQLTVQANGTQTTNLMEWEDSSGNVLAGIDERGVFFNDLNTDPLNLIIGSDAGNTTMSSNANILIGPQVGVSMTSGFDNVFVGYRAGNETTEGTTNVAVGSQALRRNTTGTNNMALGRNALNANITASNNVAMGDGALFKNTIGFQNVGVGTAALNANIDGDNNIAIGFQALVTQTSADENVAIGRSALANVTTGGTNTAIGTEAGVQVTGGTGNVFIGYKVHSGQGDASDTLHIHNADTATPLIHGDFSAGLLRIHTADSGTNAVVSTLTLDHLTDGTPAANYGVGIDFDLESSTTANQDAAQIAAAWATATHASRKAYLVFNVFDTAAREALRLEADGSAAMIGFLGATPVVRPTEITDELTTITHTAPGTPDFVITDLVDSADLGIYGASWGFATRNEGNTVLSVVANLQARVNELENTLVSLGLLTDAD